VEGNGRGLTDPNSENSWENQALFDFDGVALPALLEFEGQNSRANGSNNVAVFQRSTP
jgi:arabinogalactan endo-1,4-beta-galactosidase